MTISDGRQRSVVPISNMCQTNGAKLPSKEIGTYQVVFALVGHEWESSEVPIPKLSQSEESGRELLYF